MTDALHVDASTQGPARETSTLPLTNAPVENQAVPGEELTPSTKEVLAAMATSNTVANGDGSLTVYLVYPLSKEYLYSKGITREINSITLRKAKWKDRREANNKFPEMNSGIDQETALIAILADLPIHVLDELDARDMAEVQTALGKLLFFQPINGGK